MSPELLLVLMVALLTATAFGLFSRRPFYYLPLYWLVGVCALLIGQVIGRGLGLKLGVVGQVQLGAGLVVNLVMLIGVHLFSVWYNQPRV